MYNVDVNEIIYKFGDFLVKYMNIFLLDKMISKLTISLIIFSLLITIIPESYDNILEVSVDVLLNLTSGIELFNTPFSHYFNSYKNMIDY